MFGGNRCNPPWLGHHGGITFRVDLPVATRRSDPPAVRREAALRATAELPHPDVTIWSDGSARGGRNRAAQALIQFHHLNREETVRAPAGAVCSSLRAELTAMREAFAAVAGLEDGELASTNLGCRLVGNIVTYIAGFVVKKALDSVSCSTCQEALVSDIQPDDMTQLYHLFIISAR
ncbi:hypothetical protein FJT64_003832 [Amphibalanus amphitrite]|uniref:RNase H type-1 domain-containing protein n=1 Tax=Amphibalanus amphitrite TaxID=1232801 RepID=A0A6A4WAE2_AMPAM|nr:hypothetical protein FJT64_003832 [Amphibalanus amphitrite]